MSFARFFPFVSIASLCLAVTSMATEFRMRASDPEIVEPPLPTSARVNPTHIIEPDLPEEPCFSYRYVEAGYVYQDSDPLWGGKSQGAALGFSYDFLGPVFATGSFTRTSGDLNASTTGIRFGIGAYHALTECFQVNLEGGGAWNDTESGEYSESDIGYYVGPGLRMRLKKGVELFGNVFYSQVGFQDGLAYRTGLVIDIVPNWYLNLSADFTENVESYFAGIRYVY